MKKRIFALFLLLALLGNMIFVVHAEAEQRTLTENVETLSIDTSCVLDLDGYSVASLQVAKGAKVTLKDSQTDDFDAENGRGYGRIGTVSGTVKAGSGYVLITEADGLSAHRLQLWISEVTLSLGNLQEDGAALSYKATFGGDQVIARNVEGFGVAMGSMGKEPTFNEGTYVQVDGSHWLTGTTFTRNSAKVYGILKASNPDTVNLGNAEVPVTCRPFVQLKGAENRIQGPMASYNLRQILEGDGVTTLGVNGNWDSFTKSQKDYVLELYQTFRSIMKNWDVPRIREYEDSLVVVQIATPADLQQLHARPNGNFELKADLDMTGTAWTAVESFGGNFVGNGYTISNLTVQNASGEAMGLFGTVAKGATITDLHLQDVTIQAAKTGAVHLGAIAGVNEGTITGCTVTGTLYDDRTAATVYAGALVGTNNGTLTPGTNISVTRTAPDVLGTVNTYTTAGLSAAFAFKVADSDKVHTGLVGQGQIDKNLLWQDLSYATEYEAAELQRRRQVVVDTVYEEGTIKWTPATTIKYYNDQKNNPNMNKPSNWLESIFGSKWHIHNQTFTAGTTYIGIPYTHCSSTLDQAKYYMDLNDQGVYVLKSSVTTIKGGSKNAAGDATWENGDIGWGKYIGTDCSSALTVAWHKVSPILTSNKSNNGVCLVYTSNMVPSQYNQWYYGFRQVGDYVVDDATWSQSGTVGSDVTAGGVTMQNYTLDTDDIMAKIGPQGFYEAYAQARRGDMAVAYSRTGKVGHARLFAEDPVVIRNGEGTIDPNKSYILFHEQGAGLYVTPGQSSWRINWQCSFAEAAMQLSGQEMGGNGVGYYLPITMPALNNASVTSSGGIANGGSILTGNNPLKWALNSNYRIDSATLTIKDETGATVYEKTGFQGTSSSQNRRRAVPGSIPLFVNDVLADCCDNLVAGNTYYATLSGTTVPGVTDTKMNNYKFTYDPNA